MVSTTTPSTSPATPPSRAATRSCSSSYHVACATYGDQQTADNVKALLSYVVSEEGQQAAADAAGSAPISQAARGNAMTAIDAISAG